MTTENNTYLGTLISRKSFGSVTKNRPPPQQCRDVSSQKTIREATVLERRQSVGRGKYADQFTPERLAGAIAISERNWQHFSDSAGALAPGMQLLPHEFAAKMSVQSVRSTRSSSSSCLTSEGQKA